jgi:hypothetical protein
MTYAVAVVVRPPLYRQRAELRSGIILRFDDT